jgi:hypothetical protein
MRKLRQYERLLVTCGAGALARRQAEQSSGAIWETASFGKRKFWKGHGFSHAETATNFDGF